MRQRVSYAVMAAVVLCTGYACAEQTLLEKIQSRIDDVVRGIDYIGRKADSLIGPGWNAGDKPKAQFTEKRPFSDRYPVSPAPEIAISNMFGSVRVTTWEERVVQVDAEITVNGDDKDRTLAALEAISVQVTPSEDFIQVRTQFPENKDEGFLDIEVNYTLTVPRGARVSVENLLGDTAIEKVGGDINVESLYGAVDLTDCAGAVHVRARGEFPVRADGLAQGGVFMLHDSRAELSGISGKLAVSAFRGSVSLSGIARDAAVEVTGDSAPIHLALPQDATPDLTATALFGNVQAGAPFERTVQNGKAVVRRPDKDATQHIVLASTFSDVVIEQQGAGAEAPKGPAAGDKPSNDVVTRTYTVTPEDRLVVEAMPGDVRVIGVDGPDVRLTATRIVWTAAAAAAPAALDALAIEISNDTGVMTLRSKASQEPGALGCSAWRVDLVIECPRAMPVEIRAANGATLVEALSGAVSVEQAAGAVRAEKISGALKAINRSGGVSVAECQGDVTASANNGSLTISQVAGTITTECVQGRTVIESPRGAIKVHNNNGDVRILALDGVGGDYDVLAENGGVSIVLSPDADATLSLKAQEGRVDSAVPLNGDISRGLQEFRGRLRDGTHKISLETRKGDIIVD